MINDCKHMFHRKCLEELMKKCQDFIQCPKCKKVYGTKIGIQPTSLKMSHALERSCLPGHPGCNTIVLRYDGFSGIQGPEHPNPGVWVKTVFGQRVVIFINILGDIHARDSLESLICRTTRKGKKLSVCCKELSSKDWSSPLEGQPLQVKLKLSCPISC